MAKVELGLYISDVAMVRAHMDLKS